ncbi:MAG: hypothetical protein JSS75_00230 [Bacteroidetes bacterium]|nr:hypothetical protein [Bacteroidota bacterium]
MRTVCLIVVVVFSSAKSADAQPLREDKGYAIIYLRHGEGFAANVLRSDRDTIVVYTNDYQYLAKRDIVKIVFRPKAIRPEGFRIGSYAGIYVANMIFGTAAAQPGGFLSANTFGGGYATSENSGSFNVYATAGIMALGIAVGGGIGYLFDHNIETETTLYFSPDSAEAAATWNTMESLIERPVRQRKLRIGVTGGSVFASLARTYRQHALDAGLEITNYQSKDTYYAEFAPGFANYDVPSIQDANDFNWGRTVSVSYPIVPNIEAGVAWSWLSEPRFDARYSSLLSDDPPIVALREFHEHLDSRAYYATASYSLPIYHPSGEHLFEFRGTVGLGFASIRLDLGGAIELDSSDAIVIRNEYDNSFRKLYPSIFGTIEASYYISDAVSLGLEGSYYYIGSVSIHEMQYLYIPAERVELGNADIGFSLAFHF